MHEDFVGLQNCETNACYPGIACGGSPPASVTPGSVCPPCCSIPLLGTDDRLMVLHCRGAPGMVSFPFFRGLRF